MMYVTHEMRFGWAVAGLVALMADKGIAEEGSSAVVLNELSTQRARDFQLTSMSRDAHPPTRA